MRFSALVTIPLLLLLCLVTALDPCPSRAEANEADRLYSVGRERIAAGEYRQAEQAFAKAVVENPHHGEAMLQLARARADCRARVYGSNDDRRNEH